METMTASPTTEWPLRDPVRGQRNLDALRTHLGADRFVALLVPLGKWLPMTADAAITTLFAEVGPGFDRYPGARAAALTIARNCAVARLYPAEDPNNSAIALTRWIESEGAPE